MTSIERAIAVLSGGRRTELTVQFHMRLPEDVYDALVAEKERSDVSINGLVVEILRDALREHRTSVVVSR